jgi:hypothetical protein
MAGFNKVIGPSKMKVIDRFWSQVKKGDDNSCWLWMGTLNNRGYGIIGLRWDKQGEFKWKGFLAHRFSWILERGPINDDLCVLHQCDNPQCVNPWHLFLGTQKDNALDKVSKGRQRFGEGVPNGKLTKDQAIRIKAMLRDGVKQKDISISMSINLWIVKDISRGKTWGCIP